METENPQNFALSPVLLFHGNHNTFNDWLFSESWLSKTELKTVEDRNGKNIRKFEGFYILICCDAMF